MPFSKALAKPAPSFMLSILTLLAANCSPLPVSAQSGAAVSAPTPGPKTESSQAAPPAAAPKTPEGKGATTAALPASGPTSDLATRPINEKTYPYIKEGYAYLAQRQYDKAIKVLRKAAEDKECITARRYLAYALIQKGSAKEALNVMIAVSKMVPANAFDFYLFGAAYYAAGGTKQAKDCYNEALRQNPNYDAARAGLICSLTKQHNYEEALNAVQQGLQLTTDEKTKRYYNSLTKAVIQAQAYQQQVNNEGLVPGSIGSASTQVGGDAVKSAPIIIK